MSAHVALVTLKKPRMRRRALELPFRKTGVGPSAPGRLFRFRDGHLVCSDGLQFLRALKDESVDLLFLDPPFNLGKKYGSSQRRADRLGDDEYFAYMWQVIQRASVVLKPGGSLFLYHVPRWGVKLSGLLGESLTFRHWIAISMKNGFARGRNLYPSHYALLYFSKGEPTTFNRPKVSPSKCPHCGRMTKDYGGYEQFMRGGVNLGDIWDDLSPVRHKKHKTRRENELSLEIPRRVLQIAGRAGGLFVDPFAGSGSSVVLAREAGMRFAACDRELEHCLLVATRLRGAPSR
jgi:site-specific DNA-methyltransferase (adenine-specific)